MFWLVVCGEMDGRRAVGGDRGVKNREEALKSKVSVQNKVRVGEAAHKASLRLGRATDE